MLLGLKTLSQKSQSSHKEYNGLSTERKFAAESKDLELEKNSSKIWIMAERSKISKGKGSIDWLVCWFVKWVEKMPTANFASSYSKNHNQFKVPYFQVYSEKCYVKYSVLNIWIMA
jgi:hypothetical protein